MASETRGKRNRGDLFLKGLSSIMIPLAIALLGYFGNQALQNTQANDAKLRVLTEVMSQREASESDLRKDMFNSIMTSFFGSASDAFNEKVLQLELLTHNFHESLNLKPLFEDLRRQLIQAKEKMHQRLDGHSGSEPVSKKPHLSIESLDAYIDRLEGVGRLIANKQMLALEKVGPMMDRTVSFVELDEAKAENRSLKLGETQQLELDGRKQEFEIYTTDINTKNKEIRVRIYTKPVLSGQNDAAEWDRFEFWVGFFDFPAIDNTRLSHNQRFAVVLKQFEPDFAHLALLYFPGGYASLKDKPYYDDIIKKMEKTILFSEN